MSEGSHKSWAFKLPGSFYALGPIRFDVPVPEKVVRARIRESWFPNKKRLPVGVEVWPSS